MHKFLNSGKERTVIGKGDIVQRFRGNDQNGLIIDTKIVPSFDNSGRETYHLSIYTKICGSPIHSLTVFQQGVQSPDIARAIRNRHVQDIVSRLIRKGYIPK